jgi:hypothetical protein
LFNIERFLEELAKKYKLFHSEADFEKSFIDEITSHLPNCSVNSQVPMPTKKTEILDIFVESEDQNILVELKYRTKEIELSYRGENYNLKGHSACDQGRYDFIKDICRLERFIEKNPNSMGLAILLTNDHEFWVPAKKVNPNDVHFRIDEGKTLRGTLKWLPAASTGTTKGREDPHILKSSYLINWKDYSLIPQNFRYTYVEIV